LIFGRTQLPKIFLIKPPLPKGCNRRATSVKISHDHQRHTRHCFHDRLLHLSPLPRLFAITSLHMTNFASESCHATLPCPFSRSIHNNRISDATSYNRIQVLKQLCSSLLPEYLLKYLHRLVFVRSGPFLQSTVSYMARYLSAIRHGRLLNGLISQDLSASDMSATLLRLA
jgi:hypothetical protein